VFWLVTDILFFVCVCVCVCVPADTRLAAGSSHLILLRYETVQPNLSSLISVLSFWGFTLELKIWLFDNYTTKSLCFVFLLFAFRDIHYINHRFVYLLNIKWNLFNLFFFVSRDLHYIKANFVNFRFKSVIFFLLFFFGIQICSFISICSLLWAVVGLELVEGTWRKLYWKEVAGRGPGPRRRAGAMVETPRRGRKAGTKPI